MAEMYIIENNTIIEIQDFDTESDGTDRGFATVTQSVSPELGWTRADESSDFSDPRGYRKKRADAYPEIGKQLDNLYRDIANGTLTTSGEFYTAINAVKTSIPVNPDDVIDD